MSQNLNRRGQSYIGRGQVSMRALIAGKATSLINIGNCQQFNITYGEQAFNQKDYTDAGGGNAAKLTQVSDVTGAITTFSFDPNVIAAVMRAKLNEQAAGEDKEETTTIANLDAFVRLTCLPDKSEDIVVTVDGATDPLKVDVDYAVTKAGIQLLNPEEDASVALEDVVKVTYKTLKSVNISPLTEAQTNYEIAFDGLNEANSKKPVSILVRCAAVDVVQAFNVISGDSEFGNLPFTFEALKDDNVTEDGLSPFIQILMAE